MDIFLNFQTCEKLEENKERVAKQHWFDEFIVCYVN